MSARLWRLALVSAVCLPALGCGNVTLPIPSDLDSGITGIVLAGPTCPVQGPGIGPACDDLPLSATIVVRAAGSGLEVTRFQSDAEGLFRVPLYPGTYQLDPQPVSPSGLPRGTPQTVEVVAAQFTNVTIQYDTGIR